MAGSVLDAERPRPSSRPTSSTEEAAAVAAWWQRPAAIAICLLVFYALLSQFNDPRAYLSTDTGGKTATLEAMVSGGDWDPDLGYWAEEQDPDGSLYPMFATKQLGDKWINATSLPMLLVARPLWSIGGYRAALLLPMLGAVAAALAAGALARRLGSRNGALASWIVGVSSPAVIYALDLWEHTIGLALMGWGLVAIVERLSASERWTLALWAGLAFGFAASMRQEALVYGFVTGLVLVGFLMVRRGVGTAILNGVAMVAGTAAMIVANALLEIAVLGESFRAGRSAGAAAAGGSSFGKRVEEAIITAVVPFSPGQMMGALAGLALVVGLVWLTFAMLDGGRPLIPAVLVGGVYLVLLLETASIGLSFVQGMIATTPVAGLGLACVWRRRDTEAIVVSIIALASLPLVWAVQYTGGALPQWGGRYILLSGWVLMTLAVAHLEHRTPQLLKVIGAVGLAVTALGVAWMFERTNAIGTAFEEVVALDDEALVFADPFISREAGPAAAENQWLAAVSSEDRQEAASVLIDADINEFGFVTRTGKELDDEQMADFEGFVANGQSEIEVFDGFNYVIQHFVRN